MSLQRKALTSLFAAAAALLLALPAAAVPTPAGTTISNTATVNWIVGGTPVVTPSNQVDHVTLEPASRTVADVSLWQYAPTAPSPVSFVAGPSRCDLGGTFTALPDPTLLGGASLDTDVAQPYVLADVYHAGEPVFVSVTDDDHNTNSGTRDSVLVTLVVVGTGDTETLELIETGVNTGVFAGFVPSSGPPASANDCVLQAGNGDSIIATYTDFGSVTSVAAALVDPFGFVFDSVTGARLDGATVTLIDANTGLPASVFGDDGVSTYPATIVTGSTVMDSSSNVYVMGTGQFRFPYVSPGNYRFAIAPPAGYSFPSSVPTLSLPPGFSIAVGSRGEPFVVLPGPALHIDVPVDSITTGLLVTKTTSTEIVATGDLFEWRVTVANTSAVAPANTVVLTDVLPAGLRYRAGSARQDGVTIADPTVSPDGRSLTFAVGTIAPAASTLISYVTEVAAGTHGRTLTNSAQATGAGGATSNLAQATVQLREDLFGDRATILGEVLEDSCEVERGTGKGLGVAGVRVLMEDGSYAITDEMGRFHFRGVAAGSHVVQVDKATLPKGYEIADCVQNTRFAGRSYSQFVELQRGSLWRADFRLKRLEPTKGVVSTHLKAVSIAAERGVALFEFNLAGKAVPLANLRLSFMVPDSAELVPNSVVLDGAAVPNATLSDGVMTLRLGDRPQAFAQKIAFRLKLPLAETHEVTAVLTVDGPTKKNLRVAPVKVSLRLAAETVDLVQGSVLFTPHFQSRGYALTPADHDALAKVVDKVRGMDSARFHVVGFTDGREVLDQPFDDIKDNQDLSKRRADAVADYLAKEAGIPRKNIVIEGRGAKEPVGDNKRKDGMALNRRVIISMVGASVSEDASSSSESPTEELEIEGLRPGAPNLAVAGAAAPAAAAKPAEANYAPYAKPVDGKLLASLTPGRGILWPANDVNPPIPSVKFAVQHLKTDTVELSLNGRLVARTANTGTRISEKTDVAVTEWNGIDLQDGDNRFEAVVRDASGLPVATLQRSIFYAGRAVRAELLLDRSILVADGVTRPVIALRMLDRSGRPVHPGSSGEFEVGAPYAPWRDIDDRYTDKLFVAGNVQTGWTAGEDGVALVELAPTTDAGEAILNLRFGEKLVQDLRVWLEPAARDWVLVGLAEGSVGHNSVSGNAAAFDAAGGAPDYYEDGRIAFYAKGMVKGEYLLTLAYDTGKEHQLGGANLEQQIDPNAYYLLYGDATEQRSDAASVSNLYVRIERKQFYAMFGDMDTGLTLTELGRYSRRLNGLKSEYRGKLFSYSAFAAEDTSAFIKDEIPGDGTSGLYRLTQRPLMINSEQVRIQVRDRFHSENVLDEQILQRYTDYTIDYSAGTIFFRRPIPSHDASFNQVFIVVDYEVQGVRQGTVTAGGRGAVMLADGKVELGATVIHEGVTGAEGDLAAADIRVKLGAATTLEAEVGSSESTSGAVTSDGAAYKVEVEHIGETVVGRAYARQQDDGFGLGQQSGGESGTRKIGVEGTVKIDAQMDVAGQVYQQDVLATGAERQVAEAALRYTTPEQDYTATGGVRHAADSGVGPTDMVSDQVFLGGTARVTNDLTLRAQGEASVSGDSANVDFPDRLMVGADYKMSAKATAFVEHEIAQGPGQDSDMTRVGVRTQPWERGRVDASMEQQYSENGPRLFATLGLGQGFQVSEDLLLDFGLDRVHTIRTPGNPPFNPNVPPASGGAVGTGDFMAYYAGATWRHGDWTTNGRIETLNGDTEDRLGVSAGAYRAQGEKMGLAFRMTFRDSAMASGDTNTDATLSFGFAWRPINPAFIWLDRVDLVYDDAFSTLNGASTTYKLINNLNLNHRPDTRWETSYQYAFKYQRAEFGSSFTAFTDLFGVDSRYDLNRSWDIGGQLFALHSWEAGTFQYTAGLSVGHSFAKNVWVSVGYNFDGFEDEDFAGARYTAAGPFIQFRVKFDQDSMKDLKDWASGPVTPVPAAGAASAGAAPAK